MDIASKKLELLNWLLQISDPEVISKVEELKAMLEESEVGKKPVFGRFKGKIHLADDFDAPLEDFKEYM